MVAIAIYVSYGPRFFPSDVADSVDTLRVPGLSWPMLSSDRKGTREDKGPFGSGKPSIALLKIVKLYNIHVSSHVSYLS